MLESTERTIARRSGHESRWDQQTGNKKTSRENEAKDETSASYLEEQRWSWVHNKAALRMVDVRESLFVIKAAAVEAASNTNFKEEGRLPSASQLLKQFEEADGSNDQSVINRLLDYALAMDAVDVPGVLMAAHIVAKQQLLRAIETQDIKRVKAALIAAKRLWASEILEYERAVQNCRALTKIPNSWDVTKMAEDRKQGKPMVRAEITDKESLEVFHKFLAGTVRVKSTRDRGADKVPIGYELVKVMQVQNEEAWTDYVIRQEEIRSEMQENKTQPAGPGGIDEELSKPKRVIATHKDGLDAKLPGPSLDDSVNEVFLFHGTNPIAVENMTSDTFSFDFAGSSRGTLYGRGLYFTEHSTRADEYAKADDAGVHTLLVCRVTMGDILHTSEPEPDPRSCEEICAKEKHSVLGDRIKCNDTFREFVVFDEAQVYASFVVQYRRRFVVKCREASNFSNSFCLAKQH